MQPAIAYGQKDKFLRTQVAFALVGSLASSLPGSQLNTDKPKEQRQQTTKAILEPVLQRDRK